uniref:(northern house mosquito) hypothetical protein n=1 Tax=Culex pipiens TaxID=7175 RepID=A0A8D8CRR1_CULPI
MTGAGFSPTAAVGLVLCVCVFLFYFCYKYLPPFKRLLHFSLLLFALSTTIVCIYLICFAHHYFCSCSTIQLLEHGSLPVFVLVWVGLVTCSIWSLFFQF